MPDATDRCTCSFHMKSSIALQHYGIRAPRIDPHGAQATGPIPVTLAADVRGADIRYTLDGSSPTRSSLRYRKPLRITESATLKARAFSKGMTPSRIRKAEFRIVPADKKPGK